MNAWNKCQARHVAGLVFASSFFVRCVEEGFARSLDSNSCGTPLGRRFAQASSIESNFIMRFFSRVITVSWLFNSAPMRSRTALPMPCSFIRSSHCFSNFTAFVASYTVVRWQRPFLTSTSHHPWCFSGMIWTERTCLNSERPQRK